MDPQRITRRAAVGLVLGLGGLRAVTSVNRALDRFAPGASANASGVKFLAWASASARSREAYTVIYTNPDLMATLPCYCGCGTFSPPHRDLLECFMQRDGRPEAHAAGCETCQDEALDAAQWEQDGMPWPEIRARIMATYSDVGPPTPGRRA